MDDRQIKQNQLKRLEKKMLEITQGIDMGVYDALMGVISENPDLLSKIINHFNNEIYNMHYNELDGVDPALYIVRTPSIKKERDRDLHGVTDVRKIAPILRGHSYKNKGR